MTSTRDARVAGISEAITAAAISTAAAPASGRRARHFDIAEEAAGESQQRQARDHAGDDSRAGDHRALARGCASAGSTASIRSRAARQTRASAR